jgi:hypothetical protein
VRADALPPRRESDADRACDQRRNPFGAQKLKTGSNVALIGRAREVRETALYAAENHEIRQGIEHRKLLSGSPDLALKAAVKVSGLQIC